MKYIYLDLNVFDKLEKLVSLNSDETNTYTRLLSMINSEDAIVPYSNAHIHDLMKGYTKSPELVKGHLSNIELLTKNLCIVQYWGENEVNWHYRDIHEFFESAWEDSTFESPSSFKDIFLSTEVPESKALFDTLNSIKLPESYLQMYAEDPIFEKIFPTFKTKLTVLSMCEDLHTFSKKVKIDFSLYRGLRQYVKSAISKFNNESNQLFESVYPDTFPLPGHLTHDSLFEKINKKASTSKNELYSEIIDVYFKTDFKGIHSDAKFSNMFEDSLHTFYAAHCDFFISNDEKCRYKAIVVYEKLGITTKVRSAQDFVNQMIISSSLENPNE